MMRFAATATLGLALLLAGCADTPRPPEVGGPAPEFTAMTLDGNPVTLEDLKGQPFMLNIWATWCGPCRAEMPELQELHDAYNEHGFSVVGVSVDNRAAGDLIAGFLDELEIEFPIYHDATAEIQDSYFLLGLPGSFLVDSDGTIVRTWTGPIQAMSADIQADVRRLVGLDPAVG